MYTNYYTFGRFFNLLFWPPKRLEFILEENLVKMETFLPNIHANKWVFFVRKTLTYYD